MQDESKIHKSPIRAENVGFKRASYVGGTGVKKENGDFSFMKKKVRVNVVDKNIQEYQLDQDEIDAKKRKGKKYL